ncbi:MAG: carboxynorspermidine decarboxylase, partial [Candidatus Omnitrophota bacterium]
MALETPYYLIDERRLLKNLKIIKRVRDLSGAKSLLALKCFSTWSVFKLMRQYLDGTTASSPYEARLGYEKFGKEVHVYSVGFSKKDITEVRRFADTIIFNSLSQLEMFYPFVRGRKIGLRVNPGVSYSEFDLADPARKFSRLGVTSKQTLLKALPHISGVMFHYNCENGDFRQFSAHLEYIGCT